MENEANFYTQRLLTRCKIYVHILSKNWGTDRWKRTPSDAVNDGICCLIGGSIWHRHHGPIPAVGGVVMACGEWFCHTILDPSVPSEHCLYLIAYTAGWNTVADQIHPFTVTICIFSSNRCYLCPCHAATKVDNKPKTSWNWHRSNCFTYRPCFLAEYFKANIFQSQCFW